MQNTWSISFLSTIKFLFVNRFAKFMWHLLGLLKCKRVTRLYFFWRCLTEQGDMQQGCFQRMCGHYRYAFQLCHYNTRAVPKVHGHGLILLFLQYYLDKFFIL